MAATGSYLNEDIHKEGLVCGEDILRELIREKCSPQSASTNVHIGDRKILVGNSSPSPFEEREREGGSPSCLADSAEGNLNIPDLIKEEIQDIDHLNVYDHEGSSNLENLENDDLESSSGSCESYLKVLPTDSNSSVMSNSNSYDLEYCIKERSQLSYDYDGDADYPNDSVPDNGLSVTPLDEELIIEAIMNEVKEDSLFDSLNPNDVQSPSNVHMSGFESYEVNNFGEDPNDDSLTLAGVSDFSRSHEIERNNDACSDEVEGVKNDFECLSGIDNFEIENSSPPTDDSVSGTIENNDRFNNKDEINVKEMSDNPFGNVSDNCVETFCDTKEPFKTDEKGKESSKPKSRGGTKKGNDGKKTQSSVPVIDEDVLNEVKSLLAKHQSSNSSGHIISSLEKAEKCSDPAQTKTKEKKKKKKTKRSNSKTDTSLISLPEESTSPTQRRILKRGTIWKEKRGDKEGSSPIPSEDKEQLSSENESLVLERSVGKGREEVLHSHVSSNEKLDFNEAEILPANTSTEANSHNEMCVPTLNEIECDVSVNTIKESHFSVLAGDKCDGGVAHENSNFPTISVDDEVESSTESKEIHLIVKDRKCFEDKTVQNCEALDTNKEEGSCILSDPSKKIVNSYDVANEYRPLNDSEVFTFNTTLSVVKPLKPCIEIVSDNSSPISTRSNSMDREVLPTSLSKPSYDGEVIIEDNCLVDEVCVPPLFDNVEASKLDGTNKITLNYKKRHSLTKNKIFEEKNPRCDAFNSFGRVECVVSPESRTSDNEPDVGHYYKDAGDPLYNERCQCSLEDDSKIGVNVSASGIESPRRGEGATEREQVTSDDSDDTDTWHPKNIKEKIQRIIGARLQPPPERVVLKEPLNDPKEEASHFLRSSPQSTSKPLNETHDCVPEVSKNPTKNESLEATDGADTQHTLFCSKSVSDGEDENDEGKYQQKLNFNSKHLNLTYLTDSDEPVHEVSHEDILMLESLKAVGKNEAEPINSIVQRWETLQSKAVERQRQSTQLRQLQRQVKTLRLNMEGVLSRCSTFAHAHTLDDPSQIGRKVEEAKALLEETENLRTDMSDLNVMVHRFTSEVGSSFTPLKDEMAELYRLWDETHRRVTAELSSLQSAEATWRLWEEQKAELSQALKQDSDTLKVLDAAIDNGGLTETVTASVHDVAKLLNEKRIPNANKAKSQAFTVQLSASGEKTLKTKGDVDGKDDRLSDSGTSGYESCSSDDLSERERRLAYLRRLAKDLEASLVPGSKAWNEIVSTLSEAEKELQGLQDHCRSLILRTAETLEPSSTPLRFSSNSKRRNWARESKSSRSPRMERRAKSGNLRREWIRRVVWAALPFQAALLLMLCVACLLEPNCCDSVNTLNFSFTPQLRFVHGSPPV